MRQADESDQPVEIRVTPEDIKPGIQVHPNQLPDPFFERLLELLHGRNRFPEPRIDEGGMHGRHPRRLGHAPELLEQAAGLFDVAHACIAVP